MVHLLLILVIFYWASPYLLWVSCLALPFQKLAWHSGCFSSEYLLINVVRLPFIEAFKRPLILRCIIQERLHLIKLFFASCRDWLIWEPVLVLRQVLPFWLLLLSEWLLFRLFRLWEDILDLLMIVASQRVRDLLLHSLLSDLVDQLRSLCPILTVFAENLPRMRSLPQVRRLWSHLFIPVRWTIRSVTIRVFLNLDVRPSCQHLIPLARCHWPLICFLACAGGPCI